MDFGIPIDNGSLGAPGQPTCWEWPTTLWVAFRGAARKWPRSGAT